MAGLYRSGWRMPPCRSAPRLAEQKGEAVVGRTIQRVVAALAATLLLAVVVGSASARSLSSTTSNIRATFASIEFATEAATVRCRVTLEGSFHTRTIAKVVRSLIGAVTRAIVAHPCTGGEAWADNGTEAEPLGTAPNRLPFHLTYENFTGTLPNITSIGLLYSRFSFVIQCAGICTGRYGSATDNISMTSTREAGGAITSLAPVAGRNIATLVTTLAGFLCPATGAFMGSGTPTVLNNTNRITITLI